MPDTEAELRDNYGLTLESALLSVEGAARELEALFDGDPDGWRLGGRLIVNVDVSNALLSLHDYLNDVAVARAARECPESPEERHHRQLHDGELNQMPPEHE